jgi:hypothetical protein
MRRVRACAPAGAVLFACAVGGVASAAPDGGETEPAAFALVWHDATFRTAPDWKAPSARAYRRPSSHRLAYLGGVWPVKARYLDAGFYEVETPGELDPRMHCYDKLAAFDGLRLRLYVHESDLALATTRPTAARRVRFPGDVPSRKESARLDSLGEVKLAAGVALLPQEPRPLGHYLVGVDDFTFAVSLGDEPGLARTYAPVRRPLLPSSGDQVKLPVGSKGWFRTTDVFERRKVGGANRATIHERCLETDLPLPAEASGKRSPPGLDDQAREFGSSRRARLNERVVATGALKLMKPVGEARAGAKATWPDGRAAGVVERGRVFELAAPAAGERTCFRIALADDGGTSGTVRDDATLSLCFAAADLAAGAGAASVPVVAPRGPATPARDAGPPR